MNIEEKCINTLRCLAIDASAVSMTGLELFRIQGQKYPDIVLPSDIKTRLAAEAAWSIIMPIIDPLEANTATGFPNYSAGMQGPADAEALIARNGYNWIVMPLEEEDKK
jgi:hypothetical protein